MLVCIHSPFFIDSGRTSLVILMFSCKPLFHSSTSRHHHHHPAFSHYCAESYIQRLPISAHPSRRRSVAPPRDLFCLLASMFGFFATPRRLHLDSYTLFLLQSSSWFLYTHSFSGVELCKVCFRESYVPNSEIPNLPPSLFKGYLLRVVENIQQLLSF